MSTPTDAEGTNEEQAAYHRSAANYLRIGIYEQKPWLRGVASYEGPASDHDAMAQILEDRAKGSS